jgi:hypothetical protein
MLLITCPKKTELPDKTFNIKKLSMKTIIGVIILVVVIGGIVSYKETSLPVYHKEVTEVTIQEEVKEAWMTDEEAIQAAKDVIKKKELEAELKDLQAVQASTTERIKQLQKELGTF